MEIGLILPIENLLIEINHDYLLAIPGLNLATAVQCQDPHNQAGPLRLDDSSMRSLAFAPLIPLPRQSRHVQASHSQFSYRPNSGPSARIGEKTLAVDYGLRRVGLAVSVGVAPRPLPRLEHKRSPRQAAFGVAAAAKSTLSTTILVGYPVDMNGNEGEQTVATKLFLRELVHAAPWAKILYLDERFTSQEAREGLEKAGVRKSDVKFLIDSASAVVLLERFFSEGDEVHAVEVHRPPEVEQCPRKSVERVSFAEWKKQAMDRAKQMTEDGTVIRRR